METKVINLFGGPGTGKSTTAAGVFTLLKLHGVNCELVTEFAKDLTWEERTKTLSNQTYILGKQYHRMWRLKDNVDVIVTDSPLLLSLVYLDEMLAYADTFKNYVLSLYHEFNNYNWFLKREKSYNPKGRKQTEEEAITIDSDVFNMLEKYYVGYLVRPGDFESINNIVSSILCDFERAQHVFISH